ncbi:hypothetical protein BH11BAC3_BH11BAC3_09340 [soil metagenome]
MNSVKGLFWQIITNTMQHDFVYNKTIMPILKMGCKYRVEFITFLF